MKDKRKTTKKPSSILKDQSPDNNSPGNGFDPGHPDKGIKLTITDKDLLQENHLEGLTISQEIRLAKKQAICDIFIHKPSLSAAAEAVGVHPSTAWRWMNEDAAFKAEILQRQRAVGDKYQENCDRIANDPKHGMSGTMNIFMLKRFHPEFRENYNQGPSMQDNRQIHIHLQDGTEEDRERLQRVIDGQIPKLRDWHKPQDQEEE